MSALVDPRGLAPLPCALCDMPIAAKADHEMIPGGFAICRRCSGRHEGPIAVWAPDRAAAHAWLIAHDLPTTEESPIERTHP